MNMRKNYGAQPYLYPMPVLIIAAYDEGGNANAMNAAWGGIIGSNTISMCLSAGHKTVKNILKTKAFTVSIGTVEQVVACDYLGLESGNQSKNKLETAGFHLFKSEFVNAPLIEELPMALECRLESYDPKTSRMIGEIVNVCVDESVMDENGNVDVKKLRPITFDRFNRDYLVLGEKVGNAYGDGNKLKK